MSAPTHVFWNWFTAHAEPLTMLADLDDTERNALLDEMQKQLTAYCDGLTCEVGEPTSQGRTLTISAEGDFDLFPRVVELVENAPDVDWWEFVAFRQPKGKNLRVLFDKYRFETARMAFQQLENEAEPEILGLRIAIPDKYCHPGTQPDDDLLVGVYVTLEALLGEFDCTTLIGYVDVCPLPEEPFKSGFRPLDDLPDFVEWFKKSVNSD